MLNKNSRSQSESVIVLYETPEARDHLLTLAGLHGEHLTEEDARTWMPVESIESGGAGEAFFRRAVSANAAVFVGSCKGDFSPALKLWMERWAAKRDRHEGVLIGVFHDRRPMDMSSVKELHLRHIARTAGLDYLSELASRPAEVPDSIDSFTERAGKMTSVLNCILSTRIPPTLPG